MVDVSAQRDTTRGSFLFESTDLRFSSPLYAALSRPSAEDEDICGFGSVIRPGQPIGIFIMSTAQYLAFKEPQAAFAAYLPSLTDSPKPAAEAFPAFREFCLERRELMRELLATRTVNANLVERTSTILPISRYISGLTGEPLALVEICCSAGLNLMFDEYHYDYGPDGQVGPDDAAVRLNCKIISKLKPAVDRIPQVARKVGIDLVGVDCSSPDERLWMEAMLFPEWRAERARIKKALELRAQRDLRIVTGDAVEALPIVLEDVQGPLMLLHSFCMGQWFAAAEGRLNEILREASRTRDIHRIGIETPDGEPPQAVRARLAALSAARIPLTQKSLAARVEHTPYLRGVAGTTQLLGHADGLGSWIDWHVPG